LEKPRLSALVLAAVLLAFPAARIASTDPPDRSRESATSAQGSGASQVPLFPSGTEAVRLDMVVRTRDGRMVTDLRPDEVQVFENGHPCAIGAFRLVQAELEQPREPLNSATAAARAPEPRRPPEGKGETLSSLVVLVFDQLGPEGGPRSRAAALDMLKRPFPKDTWFAVYKIGDGLRVLQTLTFDRSLLPAAIEKATTGAERSRDLPMFDQRYDNATEEAYALSLMAAGAGMRAAGPGTPGIPTGGNRVDLMMLQMQAGMARLNDQITRESRGAASLYPMLGIVHALATVQGRKTLLYFSEGLDVPPKIEDVFHSAVSTANRANVSVYSFDARGLKVHPPSEETRLAMEYGIAQKGAFSSDPKDLGPGDTETFLDAIRLNRQGTLGDLAESTGGFLVADTNDLRAGLERVASDLRSYYDIGYAAPDPAQDGRWREIKVEVTRPGVTVRTRKGYYAFPPGVPIVRPAELPLMTALEAKHLARDVEQRPAVLRVADAGREQQVLLIVEVPLESAAIVKDEAAGLWRADVQLLGHVKDERDQYVARLTHDAQLEGPLGEVGTAQRGNLVVRRSLRLAPGRYTLETVVQDRQSGKLGARRFAFEVPHGEGLSLGSVAIVRTDEMAAGVAPAPAGATDDVGEALRVGNLRAAPVLVKTFSQGTPAISLFLSAHPGSAPQPVEIELEFRRDGQTVARSKPRLPAADASGRIAYIGSFPIAQLAPGRYEVWARARQGEAEAVEETSFTIMPVRGQTVSAAEPTTSTGGGLPKAPAKPPTAAPEVLPILEKAGQYVLEFQQSFRYVVAEETYRQWAGSKVRTLRSDLVFVTVPAEIPWATFRDVYDVDGHKVRDREARLEAIFAKKTPSSLEQANAILRESARFNLGPIYRTVNVPTLALAVLHPGTQWRFRWERLGKRTFFQHDGVELHAVETAKPTLVRERDGGGLPLEARLWVEASTGRVLRTEVGVRRKYSPDTAEMTSWILTQYRPEPSLGLWVPDEMVERYENVPFLMREDMEDFDGTIQGRASYANYRRFSVDVSEGPARLPEEEP